MRRAERRRQSETRSGTRGVAFIEVRDLTLTYETAGGPIRALDRIDLAIAAREFVTIVGPSGCGKSTFLNILGGLLAPSSGAVYLDGATVSAPSARIGYVFQDPVLLPWRTVIENVLLPADLMPGLTGDMRARAKELLELVGLAGFQHNYPAELSGGMRQRVAIARALLPDPEVLLMDEPFGALDALTRERMGFELLRIWQGSGKTLVFVTHSIPEAVFLADRVIAMTARPGRIARTRDIAIERPRTVRAMEDDAYLAACREFRELMLRQENGAATRVHPGDA
jgi:NitT/TauT family transport system ATP-binding protein